MSVSNIEYIADQETAAGRGLPSTISDVPELRRRRIEFLLRVLDAPAGVRRPYKKLATELQDLIDLEWPDG